MSRAIEIIDPEGERRYIRRRRAVVLAAMLSLCLFGYPEARDYYTKWQSLRAGRELALYLSNLKTRAILKKTPMEARFRAPDQIEVYEVTTCGPGAQKTKVSTTGLGEFRPGVEFPTEAWIREHVGTREPILPRFCYDPLYGSSVFADGLVHGGIFLAHRTDIEASRGEHAVQLLVEGAAGDVGLD